jgi:putative ABC transport system permease protein
MLRAVARKAIADLRSRPLQAGLLFAVIAAAAMTLSLALNVQSGAAAPADRLRRETNGADLWVSTFMPQADRDALSRLPGVVEVSGPYPVSWSNYGISKDEKKQQFALVGMDGQLPEFDHPVVTSGRWLSATGSDEIVIDRGSARRLGLSVGERVDLLTPSGPRPFTIVGVAVPTGRVPAPINDPAFGFVLRDTLQRLEPDAVFGASSQHQLRAGIRLQDSEPDGPGTVSEAFIQQARISLRSFDIRTWGDVRQNLAEANEFDVIFLNVFSVFALLAAGLIIANAVGGQVLSQVRDTGILKAVGFTPAQVTLGLLLQNLAVALAAGIVGIVAGLMVAPFFLERTAALLGVPASAAIKPGLLALTLIVVCMLVGLFTLLPAWRAGRVAAIAALSAGNDSGSSRPSRLAGLAAAIGLPRVAAVGLKDLSRRPVRTAMTIAALILAVVTTTFTLGIEATFAETMKDLTVIGGPPYDIASDRDTYPDAEARRLLNSRPEVKSYLVVYNTDGVYRGQGFDLRGIEGDLSEPRWALREGRMPERAGEATVSTRLASNIGLKVGDRVEILAYGRRERTPTTIEVVGMHVDYEGEVIMVKSETLPPDVEITDYLIATREGTDNKQFARDLITASGGYLDPEILDESVGEIRSQFRSVLVGLNAVLFIIAGLNLLSSLLLSIRERQRDFAVLKTVGFTPVQVAKSVFSGSIAQALVAVLIGLPVGLIATRLMFDALSSAADIGTGVGAMPGVLWLAPLVPGAIAVAALGTVIPARRAASIQVAEAMRYE